MTRSAGLLLYRAAAHALGPLAGSYLAWRARRGREDPERIGERLGRASLPRPSGPLVWLHGASIGEGLSLLPLAGALRARRLAILITTGTSASAHVIAPRLPAGALHQLAPLDTPRAIRAFLDHWRPDLLLLAESELWPTMIGLCARRTIPIAIVNGRLSARSVTRWQRAPRAARALLGAIAVCVVQSDAQATFWRALGARTVVVAGNLKHDAPAPPADPHELARLRAAVGRRPVMLAASTHAGDEALVLAAHLAARNIAPDLLTILVPRDVARGAALAEAARQAGLTTARRARGTSLTADVAILVADTVGEMGLWLRLASLVVIGKTFGEGGGQTPLEAARCGVPIVHGPSTTHFADIFAALDAAGGARCIAVRELGDAVASLLRDPAGARAMARSATRVVETATGATARTMVAIEPLLPRGDGASP